MEDLQLGFLQLLIKFIERMNWNMQMKVRCNTCKVSSDW